jgi:hypothetical protein
MNISAIHRGKPGSGSAGVTSGRRPARLPALSQLTLLAGAVGLMILASACASGPPHQVSATGARPRHATAALAASRPAPAPAASRPAPTASPATGATAAGYTGPHFTTPQAAMTYMAAAYNSDDTTAMHAVTDPQAFTSLLAMRSSDVDLRLKSCTATPRGDYMCSVRYSDPASRHNSGYRTAMLIAAPALNPGWYMYRFLYGCD